MKQVLIATALLFGSTAAFAQPYYGPSAPYAAQPFDPDVTGSIVVIPGGGPDALDDARGYGPESGGDPAAESNAEALTKPQHNYGNTSGGYFD